MLVHSAKITIVIFVYMALFGHGLPSLSLPGPLAKKDKKGLLTMLKHSLKLGFLVFLYMGVFGHKLPSLSPKGPFLK